MVTLTFQCTKLVYIDSITKEFDPAENIVLHLHQITFYRKIEGKLVINLACGTTLFTTVDYDQYIQEVHRQPSSILTPR